MLEILTDIITSLLFSAASYRGAKILRLQKHHCRLLRWLSWPTLVIGLAIHLEHGKNFGFALVCWCLGLSLAFALSGALLGCLETFQKPSKTIR